MHANSGAYGNYQQMQYSGYAACGHYPQDQQLHYHAQYANSHQGYVPASCLVCQVQSVESHGAVCSRRCEWVAHGCCPQCGRMRSANGHFCSPICAAEARQANWCVCCGVRQLCHGAATCGAPACVATAQRVFARVTPPAFNHNRRSVSNQSNSTASSGSSAKAAPGPQRNNGGARPRFEPHVTLSTNDKIVMALRQQLGTEAGKRIVAVVKVGGSVEERKRYTAYRCRVESEMNDVNGIGAPKFGHGGEGNEQKRFIPLRSECGLTVLSSGEVQSCGSSACEVCTLLECGIRATCHSPAIPAFSAILPAAGSASGPENSDIVAVATCRVTIGNANVVDITAVDTQSGAVPAPGPKHHATVVAHESHDVAYVTANEATVDPLYVLFLRA